MKTKFILSLDDLTFFLNEIKKIIYTKDYLELKKYNHHGKISTYSHSIKVAYLAFYFAKKRNLKINYEELIRSALLHDLYFYDWHDRHNGVHLHGLFHPKKAVNNATRLYNINKREKRNMAHHMFPLTLIPPTTKAGWIICLCDKLATSRDYKAMRLKKKALKKLKTT